MRRFLPILVLAVAVVYSGLGTLLDQSQRESLAQAGNGAGIAEVLSADVDTSYDDIATNYHVTLPDTRRSAQTGFDAALAVLLRNTNVSIRAPPFIS